MDNWKETENYAVRPKMFVPEDHFQTQENEDEKVIWQNFQDGSEEALIFIYRNYAGVLYNYGCHIAKKPDFVQDCIQELFCELIKSRNRLGKVTSIKGYLFKSLKRKIIRGLKKERCMESLDDQGQLFELSIPAGTISISQVPNRDQAKLLEDHLNQLPVNQREVLLLYFYEGLGYQEIADIFEVKVKSIRTQTYRALDTLAKLMESKKDILFSLAMAFVFGLV